MEKQTAELIVKIYSVLSFIGALFSFIGGLALLFAGSLGGSMMGGMMGLGMLDAGMFGGMFAALGIVLGVFMVALAVFYFFVGLHLWQKHEWARIAIIVLSVLQLFSFPVGTIIGGLGIYFFGFEQTVRKQFK